MPLTEAAAKFQSAANDVKKVLEKDKIARRAAPKFAAFFRDQKALVLAQLESKLKPHFPEPSEAKTQKLPKDLEKIWNTIWDGISEDTTGTLQKLILSTEQEGLIKGALQLQTIIRPTDKSTWDLGNPRAVAWFKENGGSTKYITGIQDTTKDEIKTLITDAIDGGKSYTQTAKEISERFDGFSRERAQTIAVYESAQAYEQGNMEFAQGLADEGVEMEKFYQTSEDNLVSDICERNQLDDWIPINQYHSSGVQQPPGHVRCRCFEKYRERKKE
jgi:hypothetical protein